jgi:hypothetical protein
VTQNGPCDAAVLELVGRDLASEGAAGLVKDVLRSDLEAFTKVFAGQKKVESWRGDDDLYIVVLVECFWRLQR